MKAQYIVYCIFFAILTRKLVTKLLTRTGDGNFVLLPRYVKSTTSNKIITPVDVTFKRS